MAALLLLAVAAAAGTDRSAFRRLGVAKLCSENVSADDVMVRRALGALCHGGGGAATGPCYMIDVQTWSRFAAFNCRPHPDPADRPRWVAPFLRSVRGHRLLLLGDSMTVQSFAALRCGLESAGVATVPTDDWDGQKFHVAFTVPSASAWVGYGLMVDTGHISAGDLRHFIDRTLATAVMYNVGLWYGHGMCESGQPIYARTPNATGTYGDLETGRCPFGWRRRAWMQDIGEVVRVLSLWQDADSGRAALLRETSVTHWRRGFYRRGPNTTVSDCEDLRASARPAPSTLRSLGGGASFCGYPFGDRSELNHTMEASQSRMLRMLAAASGLPVVPWFEHGTDSHTHHPGAYWIHPVAAGKLYCDCTHWCYTEELWNVHFESLTGTLQRALPAAK